MHIYVNTYNVQVGLRIRYSARRYSRRQTEVGHGADTWAVDVRQKWVYFNDIQYSQITPPIVRMVYICTFVLAK